MNKAEQEKIKKFILDETLQKAVYNSLLDSFLKPRSGDVYTLAASRIAIDLLQEAWGKMKRVSSEIEQMKTGQNPGL